MAKITTKSTAKEIGDYFKKFEDTLTQRAFNKIEHNISALKREIGYSGSKCTSDPKWASHYNDGDLNITYLQIGISLRKPKGVEKLFNPNYYFVNSFWEYTFLKDLDSQKPVLVANSGSDYVLMFETHALARYRERFLKDVTLDFEDVAKTLLSRNALFLHNNGNSIYGTKTDTLAQTHWCRDGLFLGYIDMQTNVYHLCTFISDDMLSKRQVCLFRKNPTLTAIYEHERNTRETPEYKKRPIEQKTVWCRIGEENGEYVIEEATQEEFQKEVQAIADAYNSNPEAFKDAVREGFERQKEKGRKMFKRKMMRKGYK